MISDVGDSNGCGGQDTVGRDKIGGLNSYWNRCSDNSLCTSSGETGDGLLLRSGRKCPVTGIEILSEKKKKNSE